MTNAAPGWYPDASGTQRWWDGAQWSQTTQAPYVATSIAERAPEGTSPHTAQVWWIVAIFGILSLASTAWIVTFDWTGYMGLMMPSAVGPYGSASNLFDIYGFLFTPQYFALLSLSFFAYAGTVALAFFDAKELTRRGVQRPFPWALSFVPSYGSLVYVIGRSVVARRRTGSGLSPMGVYFALIGVYLIVSIVGIFAIMANMFDSLNYLYTSYP